MKLDHEAVATVLRAIIRDLDYDFHKSMDIPEDGGPSWYPDMAAEFIEMYETFGQ